MKSIKLTKGRCTVVDDDNFDNLNQYKWCYCANGYAVRRLSKEEGLRLVYMHRVILNAKENQIIDHKNGNKLDNRESNLRFVTTNQNALNRGKRIDNTSGETGVSWDKYTHRWSARININNKQIWIGRFKSKKQAVNAYKKAQIKYHGEFRRCR